MQAMRNFLLFSASGFFLYALFVFFSPNNARYFSVSDAQAALPAGIQTINLAEIKSYVAADEPRVVFLYASWCPYCKKQMAGFEHFKKEYPLENMIAISTDSKLENLVKYITTNPSSRTPYIYEGGPEIVEYLEEQGGSFSGGIPYFAVFKGGKFQTEFVGLTHPELIAKASQN